MKKVNDTRIYEKKFYPWYYTENMDVNLVPISYYTELQAELTLSRQFEPQVMKELHIIEGRLAIKNGWTLGKNSFRYKGKRQQIKKYLFPAELSFNKARRRRYAKSMHKFISSTRGRSGRTEYLNKFFLEAYGYRKNFY
jgi:hypothetical protein